MSLPNVDDLDFTENDNIIDEAMSANLDDDINNLISKVNNSGNIDISVHPEEKNLANHIEDRRKLNERLQNDEEFRAKYMLEQQKLAEHAKLDLEEQIKKMDDKINGVENNDIEYINEPTFPALEKIANDKFNKLAKPAKNIVYIKNSTNITLNF